MNRQKILSVLRRQSWLAILIGWMALGGSSVLGANQLTVTKAIQGGLTTVSTGVEFTYLINYAYASTTENGVSVRMEDVLDSDLSWSAAEVTPGTSVHVASTTYDSATGKVIWNFVNPLPAGSSGQLTLKVRFPLGSTPPGTVAVNTAKMTANNAPTVTSSPVSITATASCGWVANVTGPSSAVIGQSVTYQARVERPNQDTGNLNITSGTLQVTLPIGVLPADIVSLNGGTTTGTGLSGSPVVVSWTIGSVSANGNDFSRDLVLKYAAARFTTGTTVSVAEQMNVTVLGGSSCGGTDSLNTKLSDFTPAPNGSVSKDSSDASVIVGSQSFYYKLTASNSGNVALDTFTITDPLPTNFALASVRLPTVDNGPGGKFITVKYRRSDTGVTDTLWPGSPFSAATTTLPVSALALPSGVYVSQVQFEFGTVSAGFGINTDIRLSGTLISPGWGSTAPLIITGSSVCNTMSLNANYGGAAAFSAKTSQKCVTASNPTALPRTSKSVISGDTGIPGLVTTWQVEVSNNSSSDLPIVNPMGLDLLPATLEYVDGSFTRITANSGNTSGAAAPTLEVLPNYNSTGRTLLRWTYSATFAINTKSTVQFQTRVKAGTAPGSISNRSNVSLDPAAQSGSITYQNPTTDSNDLDKDGLKTDQLGQSGSQSITVGATASLDSYKLVRGQLDVVYSKYPDFANTSPGGTADYRLVVKNSGNVGLTNIFITDILPVIGDTAVTSTSARDSAWTPFLAGPVSAPNGVTVYYSTASNPQRDDMGDPDPFPAGSTAPNWTSVPPVDITKVRSVRFDFGRLVLAPLDQFELNWPMRAPVNAPTGGEIAWNSFGVVATRVDNKAALLPTEPIKVGIRVAPIVPAAYGNRVWVDTNQDGLQNDPLIEPGLDGVRVELYRDNGDKVSDPTTDTLVGFTLTSGGGQYLFSNLPPGDYYAVFFRPPSYSASPARIGSDAGVDSDGVLGVVRGFSAMITPLTTLVSGEVDPSWDQGFYQPQGGSAVAAVGNYVWFDENTNGLQDDSSANGINGVEVKLYNGSGTLQGTRTTANDVDGNPGYYLFDQLTPGSYYLQFTLPTGFTFTTRGATGSSDAPDSDPDVTTGRTETFTVSAGSFDPTWDAGMRLPTGTLSLGDRVWVDANGNGIYEPDLGELGVDSVKLNLYRDLDGNGVLTPGTDQFFSTTTTFTKSGVPGFYVFDGLVAGNYIVQVDSANFTGDGPLVGLGSTTGNGVAPDPDNNTDNDDNGEPMVGQGVVSQAITLSVNGEPDGNYNGTVDFGFLAPAALGNQVWLDTNNDGLLNNGETGINGVTVQLYKSGQTPGVDPPYSTQMTATAGANDGIYSFQDLPPGNYVVYIPVPPASTPVSSGATDTGDNQEDNDDNGSQNASGQPVTSPVIALASGETDLTIDFGFTFRCEVGDCSATWKALDANRLQITIINPYGLSTVEALRPVNITATATVYDRNDNVLGPVLSLTTDSPVVPIAPPVRLPLGAVRVEVTGTKVKAGNPASMNARAFNMCGTASCTIDPVITQVEIGEEGVTRQVFADIPSFEHYVSVQNGRPGLRKLRLIVNGHVHDLSGLADDQSLLVDIAGAMEPGSDNKVVIEGEGEAGSSAMVVIGDAPTGDGSEPVQVIVPGPLLQIVLTPDGLELSWPVSSSGLEIQSLDRLSTEGRWMPRPEAPMALGDRWVLRLPAAASGTQFLRLEKR